MYVQYFMVLIERRVQLDFAGSIKLNIVVVMRSAGLVGHGLLSVSREGFVEPRGDTDSVLGAFRWTAKSLSVKF